MYIVILNKESESIDCLDLVNKPNETDLIEYVENTLDYSLMSCEWILTDEKPTINLLN